MMVENLKGKYFIASRGFYGTNSVTYKGIEIEVTKYNHDYTNPVTSFDWGSSTKAATLLAYVMLNTIATPTVARVYANKYTKDVISKLTDDDWKMEAIEVARWINTHTDYTIELNEKKDEKKKVLQETKKEQEKKKKEEEERAKEERRIAREKEFKKQIEEKLKKRNGKNNIVDKLCTELHIKHETLAKILDISMDTLNTWRLENEMPKLAHKAIEFYKAGILFKEKNTKLKIEVQDIQEQLTKLQTEIKLNESDLKKYKKIINSLDIPNLHKLYKEL
jgi:Skp family chaperone for outer membrane proteins